jgi:hypothetical protein
MAAPQHRWLTAQQTAALLKTTSAEVCRLIGLGRLAGQKEKQRGRPGSGQWLIDPKSIAEEKRRAADRNATNRSTKPGLRRPPRTT